MDVKIEQNNIAEALSELEQKEAKALEMIGLKAEGYAKALCPVDTGNLRNSITHQVSLSEDGVYIGTNVEYAPYVELGTVRKPSGQPFIRPAVENHISEYNSIATQMLK